MGNNEGGNVIQRRVREEEGHRVHSLISDLVHWILTRKAQGTCAERAGMSLGRLRSLDAAQMTESPALQPSKERIPSKKGPAVNPGERGIRPRRLLMKSSED